MTTTRVGPTRENERLPAYQLDLDSNPGHEGGERRLKGGGGREGAEWECEAE